MVSQDRPHEAKPKLEFENVDIFIHIKKHMLLLSIFFPSPQWGIKQLTGKIAMLYFIFPVNTWNIFYLFMLLFNHNKCRKWQQGCGNSHTSQLGFCCTACKFLSWYLLKVTLVIVAKQQFYIGNKTCLLKFKYLFLTALVNHIQALKIAVGIIVSSVLNVCLIHVCRWMYLLVDNSTLSVISGIILTRYFASVLGLIHRFCTKTPLLLGHKPASFVNSIVSVDGVHVLAYSCSLEDDCGPLR